MDLRRDQCKALTEADCERFGQKLRSSSFMIEQYPRKDHASGGEIYGTSEGIYLIKRTKIQILQGKTARHVWRAAQKKVLFD